MYEESEQKMAELQDVNNKLPVEGNYLLGELALAKGDYPQAIDNFKNELALDRKFILAWFGLAKAYEKNNNKSEALAAWKKILELDPSNREAKAKLRPAPPPKRKRK